RGRGPGDPMSISPRDVLFYAGGACLERFGTLAWRPSIDHDAPPTFTRTGSAYLVGSDGRLRAASANRPRISYPLVDGERVAVYLGEGSRTNAFTQSGDLTHANWTASGLASRTANQVTGPFGTLTLD